MSSEYVFPHLSGFIKEKYVYENSDYIRKAQFLLFSYQSLWGYIGKCKISIVIMLNYDS